MRRLILLGIIFLGFTHSVDAAFNFQLNSTKTNSCLVTVNRTYYISGQSYNKTLYDEFLSTAGDKYISDSRTTISMWEANSGLVSGCNQAGAWMKKSDVAPNNVAVVATAANCTFNKPLDNTKRNVQFVYNIGYSKILSDGTSGSASKFYIPTNTFLNNPNDFQYKNYPNYRSEAEAIHGNECFNVELRYCGDGILETGNGETCDPSDASKTGWGNGGCDMNSCQPINNPSCDMLSVTPLSGDAPLDVAATCTGYKVNTWKIDCGNGQVFSGFGANAGTQTFTQTCKYTSGDRSYTPQCFINDTITGNSCKKTVNVFNPLIPSILVDKKDANVFDLDLNVGNDTQTVRQGSGATFKIRVTNNGNEALKNLTLADTQAQACATKSGTFVDLVGKKFTNVSGAVVTLTPGGSGDHSNAQLEPNEWIEYTCSQGNTLSNYTNTVNVNGLGVTTNKPVTDSDPTQIIVSILDPRINVIKRDANTEDIDGNVGGNDSQTVTQGSGAVFQIIVANTGEEDLKNITLSDALAAACSSKPGTVVDLARLDPGFTNTENSTVRITISGAGNHRDDIFQVGEKFTYTCSKPNTQANYTNIIDVAGVGVTSGKNVTDSDPTEVLLSQEPAIQVIKSDANSNDLDGIQFNDTQTVVQGTSAIFHITVKNSGFEGLKDIQLTDTLAPACGTLGGTTVDLVGKKFTNLNNVAVTITFDGLGNHNDAILQIGEEFTYTCDKPNTLSNYTNTVGVAGIGITSGKRVNDDDTSPVLVTPAVYDLALRKILSSATPGPFGTGSAVRFDIQIHNQGNIAANNILISDYIPTGLTLNDANWTQSGGIAQRIVSRIEAKSSTTITINFTVAPAAPRSIVNYAEISSDDGADCDSTPDAIGTNDGSIVDNDIGTGCDIGGDEDDHDPETITIGPVVSSYDLALKKVLSSTTPGPFNKGDTVVFEIQVSNQGTVPANNIEITDYIPTGLTLNDSGWTQSAGLAKKVITRIDAGATARITIQFTIAANAPRTVKNLAEISSDDGADCDSTPDSDPSNDGTIVDNDIGTGCDVGGDEDDHDPEVITVTDGTPDSYDLALKKVLSSTTPGPFNIGSSVRFDIVVKNQGNVDALNVQVTDYIPTGLTLNDSAWVQSGNIAQRTLSSLKSGQEITLSINFTINSSAPSSLTNISEISSDDGDDCDSTTDTNASNDGTPVDNEIGTSCEPGGDEDDHDPETIPVGGVVSNCLDLTASPSSGSRTLTTNLVCSGSGTISAYKIEIRNSSNTLLQTINNSTGSVTLTSVGDYTATCFVNNETVTANACIQDLDVRSGSSGDPLECKGNTQTGSTVYCFGNGQTNSFYLNCDGVRKGPLNAGDTRDLIGKGINYGTAAKYATFDCSSDTYQCYVDDDRVPTSSVDDWFGKQAWRTGAECRETDGGTSGGSDCGNGIIQTGEQCDHGSQNGTATSECDSSCKLKTTTTWPNDGKIVFGPKGSIVVGHGQNPVFMNGEVPYLDNKSPYDLQFDKLCMVRVSDTSLKGGDTQNKVCLDLRAGQGTTTDGVIYAYERIEFPEPFNTAVFTADKNGIGSKAYGSGYLSTTIEDDGFLHTNSYFAGKLEVRVAKPAVVTVGGGTSYVKDSNTTGDVAVVTQGMTKYTNNNNFVGTAVSGGNTVSSYTSSTNSAGANSQASNDNTKYNTTVNSVTPNTATGTQTVTSFTEKFNGLDNVYIVKGKNVKLTSLPALTEPTTFIVEGGNLEISGDVDTNTNIAFIVKGGDINIATNVKKLDGTYIAIPVNGAGGNINSIGNIGTNTQLVIYGSVYGDMSDLIDERYYIDGTKSQLSVGTIVSFGSRIFHKPAPLVGQFIAEYLEATKVAK